MGVSPAIFESVGKRTEHYVPGVYSRRYTVPASNGISSGNLCIVGYSQGGKPNYLYEFGDKQEAQTTLTSGQLLEAVAEAFSGSNDYVPQRVYAMRVNVGKQSELTLKSGENDILNIKSADYGTHTNQLKLWLKAGSTTGTWKVIVDLKGVSEERDDIGRQIFSLIYCGAGDSASYAVTNSGIKLSALDGSEIIESYEFKWEDIDTVDQLISVINDTGAYMATQLDPEPGLSTKIIDACSTTPISDDGSVVTANLDTFVKTLRNIGAIGEVEIAEGASHVMPDTSEGYVYFSGAENGTYTAQDWVKTLEQLEKEDIQCIATPCTDHGIHVLISDHCTLMGTVEKKKERMALLGVAEGTNADDTIDQAHELNNECVSLVYNSAVDNNPFTGERQTISGALLACKLAGIEAAMSVPNPLTNKVLKVNGFGEKLKMSQMNKFIKNGVICCGENDDDELVCIRAVTTYKAGSLAQNERSMVREAMYMDRDLRQAYNRKIGTYDKPSESDILNILSNKSKEWYSNGYITPADDGKLILNAKVRYDGDKIYLTYDKYLRAPVNFVFITAINQVYSSTIEV